MPPAATAETVWDGVNQSYIPPEPLNLDPAVELHSAAAEEVDGVDYEVLRARIARRLGEADETAAALDVVSRPSDLR